MVGAGDIVRISIPFTAGVAAAALVPDGPVRYFVLLSSLAVATTLVVFVTMRRDSCIAIAPLFFCLGAMCLTGSELSSGGAPQCPEAAVRALEWLCGLIDSVGFSDGTETLVKALLTGRRQSMDIETVRLFRSAGAAHVLALSGLHLGVIYGMMSRLLAVIGNSRTASALRSGVIISASGFYMLMTGASPSIVRAFLFITMNEMLKHFPGRRRDPLRILCSALLIQLVLSPSSIRSTGFQLSYLAMLGIFTLYPIMKDWYPESYAFDIPRRIWDSLALSISCQAFTAPLVWKLFRTFPKYFLLTNLLALPLTELLMISSVACLIGKAAGWCPDIMKSPVETLARTLIFCLETISTM